MFALLKVLFCVELAPNTNYAVVVGYVFVFHISVSRLLLKFVLVTMCKL